MRVFLISTFELDVVETKHKMKLYYIFHVLKTNNSLSVLVNRRDLHVRDINDRFERINERIKKKRKRKWR